MIKTTLRLTEEDKALLDEMVEKSGLSMNEYLRRLIRKNKQEMETFEDPEIWVGLK